MHPPERQQPLGCQGKARPCRAGRLTPSHGTILRLPCYHIHAFAADWGADEEALLLEGVDLYGPGNWAAVSDHVGSKPKMACMAHWFATYIEHDGCPLPREAPEMAHIDILQYIEDAKQARAAALLLLRADGIAGLSWVCCLGWRVVCLRWAEGSCSWLRGGAGWKVRCLCAIALHATCKISGVLPAAITEGHALFVSSIDLDALSLALHRVRSTRGSGGW